MTDKKIDDVELNDGIILESKRRKIEVQTSEDIVKEVKTKAKKPINNLVIDDNDDEDEYEDEDEDEGEDDDIDEDEDEYEDDGEDEKDDIIDDYENKLDIDENVDASITPDKNPKCNIDGTNDILVAREVCDDDCGGEDEVIDDEIILQLREFHFNKKCSKKKMKQNFKLILNETIKIMKVFGGDKKTFNLKTISNYLSCF